jgi:aryl-alcohol dehydrogenase-like predicted oxidoreductase
MNLRALGQTGFSVSEIGVGLWGMGAWSGSNDEQSRQALQLACDHGCTFFDSAWSYGEGKSDRFLGELLARNPSKQLCGATKVPPKNLRWPASPEDSIEDVFPVDHVIEYAERLRVLLGVERIDLLQYHVWDDAWAQSRTFERAVTELRKRNLIRAFGLSLSRWEPGNGAKAIHSGLVDVVQTVYNIFDQAADDVLLPLCAEKKIGVIARVALDEGSLGGKLTLDTRFPPDDWRSRYFNPENLRETVRRVDALRAELPPDWSLPEVALRFVLSNPVISTVIVGMRTEQHVRQNTKAGAPGPLDRETLTILWKHRWDRGAARLAK